MISQVWRVFEILLEICCKTDYEMMFKSATVDLEEKFAKEISKLNSEVSSHKEKAEYWGEQVQECKKYAKNLLVEIDAQNTKYKQLQDEFEMSRTNAEDEVTLRLKFETKLNSLHSIHRELENKYMRAKQENDKY